MGPLTHLLGSWILAAKTTANPRDCKLVALAGILPDADGLGLAIDLVSRLLPGRPTQFYAHYHHYRLHGWLGALLIAGALSLFANPRFRVLLRSLILVHVHILCDFLGSRGPAPEDLWPIFYHGPFAKDPMWIWKGQWRLDAWPLRIATLLMFIAALVIPLRLGYSVVGAFSAKADLVFMGVLRNWAEQFRRVWTRVMVACRLVLL